MTRALIICAALLTLTVPAALAASPAGTGKPESPGNSATAPGQSAEKNAAKACKSERGTTAESIAKFKETYGTNANGANAFGKCVSGKVKKAEEQEEVRENAAKACKAERGTSASTIAAFKKTYGTNANGANAFGKCVSGKVKKATATS